MIHVVMMNITATITRMVIIMGKLTQSMTTTTTAVTMTIMGVMVMVIVMVMLLGAVW